MPKVDKTTYVRHKSRERNRSKQRNKEAAISPIHIQDESKNVKSEKSTSIIKNLDQKPNGLQNRRESVCARMDQHKQGPGPQVSDAKKTTVDKATYVRYRDRKHAKKQEGDISIRAQKSVRLFNVTTKTDKSTYVRYHSRKNHGTTNIQTLADFDDRLSQTKQKQTDDTVRKVDKSTFVRCHNHKQKNLPKQQTARNDKPKPVIEEPPRRMEKCTLVRFSGIDAGKPVMRALSTERTTVNSEAATQNSYAYDGTGDQIPREERRPPNTNVRTNKPNFEAGLVEKAIRFIKKQYRSTFDTGTRTEDKFRNADYLVLEEEKRDSTYAPKTVHAGNISVKRRSNAVENSEIFIKQLDYECNQVSQSFVVDFGTSAIQHLRNITRNIASNFIDEDDEDDSSCKYKPADTKDVGHQVDRVHAEVGVQVASVDRRKPVNKKGNYTEGTTVQTKLPQQLATEELIKCVEKFIYANKYKQDYEDFGAQADVDELHHTNRNRTDDQTVQAYFPQKHGSNNEKNLKIFDKKLSANNQYADVGVQKDMILFKKNGVQYTNNALQTDFLDGNIIEDTGEVCLQADFEDYQEYQSLICTEQGVQTPMLLDENKTKCRKFKNIKHDNASQNIQEYNEQNLISKVFEEKERKRRTGNLSITPQAKIKIQPKEMVQCGVQSDKPLNIDKFQACEEKNSNDSALISWFCSDQNILRVEKSAGESQGIIGTSKEIEQNDPVERLQLCACPEGETCTNECKLVEMKICTNEKTIDDEVNEINLNIRDCDTCENGGCLNKITGLGGADSAPPVSEDERDSENKYDTRKNKRQKRQKRKKEEREAKRGKRGKSKTQDETCDPNKCKSLEQLIENIPCAKIHAAEGGIHEADVKRPIGIHIKYKTPQTKYMENYTQPDVTLRDGHGRRLACEGESCGLDYHQLANILKNMEQNRRQTMSRNSYEPTPGPPIVRHHHWDNPCENIRTDNTRYRGAQSSSRLSQGTQDRILLGNSRSRSCKCLDVSSLGSQDEMGTQYDERYRPQPYANPNYKQYGGVSARSPLGPNINRHRDTHSPLQMPDYKSPTNIGRPADEERPYRYESFDGSGMYLSREPYYQYQRKSSSETSDCYYKNMLQNVLQKVPLYPYGDYENVPKCCHARDVGCDPIPELKQEKRRIWEGLFKKPCCRRCEKTCKISRQDVVDAAAGPCEGQSKRGTNSSCQRRCQLKTRPLPCRFDMEEWEQLHAKGEGTWNASSHSCGNLLEYDHSKDFDWVPANYFIQAKSSISEGSSGFTIFFGGKARDSAALVAEKEEQCVCDVPSACRQLFKKLKKCCGQTNVPETPSEDKLLARPSRSQGFKLDVTGKGSQAPGLRCCPDVKAKNKYSYRH